LGIRFTNFWRELFRAWSVFRKVFIDISAGKWNICVYITGGTTSNEKNEGCVTKRNTSCPSALLSPLAFSTGIGIDSSSPNYSSLSTGAEGVWKNILG
jgi:hypothetical protein